MIDPTWKRRNYLGRAEVTRYQPRTTIKVKLAYNDHTDLRMTIETAADKNATAAEHEFVPEAFNGWPLFGRGGNWGHVPMAGPEDDTPLEGGIDLTSLLKDLGPDKDGEGRFFLKQTRRINGPVALEIVPDDESKSKGKFSGRMNFAAELERGNSVSDEQDLLRDG